MVMTSEVSCVCACCVSICDECYWLMVMRGDAGADDDDDDDDEDERLECCLRKDVRCQKSSRGAKMALCRYGREIE